MINILYFFGCPDVNGKVVHLVERPPPRNTNSRNADRSDSNTSQSSTNRRNNDGGNGGGGPSLFRSIDGMVLGAMAIPVNASPNATHQSISHSMNPSSTLCMNRITVARHMLDCANNIVSYLENPERVCALGPFLK